MEEVQSKISIQTIPETSLIKVVVTDTDKFRAVSIANNAALLTKTTLKNLLKSDVIKIVGGAGIPTSPVSFSQIIGLIL